MEHKQIEYIPKGIQRDISNNLYSNEFLFSGYNIRFNTEDSGGLLSINNEKGTKNLNLHVEGLILGNYVLENNCTIFSTNKLYDSTVYKGPDFIYKLYLDETIDEFKLDLLYNGNLDFQEDKLMDITGYYENNKVQNIYWVDGHNVPRVINIQELDEIKEEWNDESFNFSKSNVETPSFNIERVEDVGGQFPPGTIQYAVQITDNSGTISSQVVYASDVYYNTLQDKAADINEGTSQGYRININIENPSSSKLIIYSIITTDNNSIEVKKVFSDISMSSSFISLLDTNTNISEVVSADSLLFENLTSFVASTICQKDNYLFLGNLKVNDLHTNILQKVTDECKKLSVGYTKKYSDETTEDKYLISLHKDKSQLVFDTLYDMQSYFKSVNIIDFDVSNFEKRRVLGTDKAYDIVSEYSYNVPVTLYFKPIGPDEYYNLHGDDGFKSDLIPANTIYDSYIPIDLWSYPKDNWSNLTNTYLLFLKHEDYKDIFPLADFKFVTHFSDLGDLVLSLRDDYIHRDTTDIIITSFIKQKNTWNKYQLLLSPSPDSPNSYYLDINSIWTNIVKNEEFELVLTSQTSLQKGNGDYNFIGIYKGIITNTDDSQGIKKIKHLKNKDVYSYNNQLVANSTEIKNFKKGETYRLGLQFYHKQGYFSPIFWVNDFTHSKNPITHISNTSEDLDNSNNYNEFYYPIINIHKEEELVNIMKSEGFESVRPVVVYPTDVDRTVIAQGFISPTLSKKDGNTSLIPGYLAQSPWFARPNYRMTYNNIRSVNSLEFISPLSYNRTPTYIHNSDAAFAVTSLPSEDYFSGWKANINNFNTQYWLTLIGESVLYSEPISRIISTLTVMCNGYKDSTKAHKVNSNCIAFYSPSVNFENSILTNRINNNTIKLKLIGIAPINATIANTQADGIDTGIMNNPIQVNQTFDSSLSNYGDTSYRIPYTINLWRDNQFGQSDYTKSQHSNFKYIFNNIYLQQDKELNIEDKIFSSKNNTSNINIGNSQWYIPHPDYTDTVSDTMTLDNATIRNIGVRINYNSGNHVVIKLQDDVLIPISQHPGTSYAEVNYSSDNLYPIDSKVIGSYFWIAELHQEVENKFGGTSDIALRNNTWEVCGDLVSLYPKKDYINVEYKKGDHYYQRYDSVVTWFNQDSSNLIDVNDVVSFMCETTVNLDSRYDENRWQNTNYLTTFEGVNFNLFNNAYSYDKGYFKYYYLPIDEYGESIYPTSIIVSQEKALGSSVNAWTNIEVLSPLVLDGDKGSITALKVLNNEIYCFQEKGISNILFNSRVQIPTSDGVPIEISNTTRLEGKRYISNILGSDNLGGIISTPTGIYFIDTTSNTLYVLSDSLKDISNTVGMNSWFENNNLKGSFKPNQFNNYRLFYDLKNKDLYITNKEECLVYNELLGQFTSFMSYNNVPAIFNIDGSLMSINKNNIWKHFEGDYNIFYDEFKPFNITYLMTPERSKDCIFNNLEINTNCWDVNNNSLQETFDFIEAKTEYQLGTSDLQFIKGIPSNLKRKFRLWRMNIPRDNINKRDRIRNPWAYITLSKNKYNTNKFRLYSNKLNYSV